MLLLMETLSALEEFHCRVALSPLVMLAGVAFNVRVGGNTTVTCALALEAPPGPLAVAV
jgi:hypothetical protein